MLKRKTNKLLIGTNNKGKLREIKSLLPKKIQIYSTSQFNLKSPVENGKSFKENSLIKSKYFSKKTGLICLADDSGLEVDFLEGKPGIFSARYAKNNSEKLKKLLNELGDTPYRSARLISCMVLCNPNGELVKETTGICWGEILKKPKYPNGEFESIFWVKEANKVYGELNDSQLSKLGSRGKAARELAPFLKKELGLS